MKKSHRITAQIEQVVISTKALASGNFKAAKHSIVDRVFLHTDGTRTGVATVANTRHKVTFKPELKVWVY